MKSYKTRSLKVETNTVRSMIECLHWEVTPKDIMLLKTENFWVFYSSWKNEEERAKTEDFM